jgi:hypothetical protein
VKLRILLLLIIAYFGSSAQELLMPVIPENDSIISDTSRHYLYNNPLPAELFSLNQAFQLPEFNFEIELAKRRNYFFSDLNYNQYVTGNFFSLTPGFVFPALIRNGLVFSGANYMIGDRISLGGFSYGGNSIFTAPFPNQGTDNFDFRGSTLFMEYNVSKNFKIGTSVSVTRSPGF